MLSNGSLIVKKFPIFALICNTIHNEDTSSSASTVGEDAACAADELLEADDEANDAEANFAVSMPASAQWMAGLQGKFRSYGKVIGNHEWEYFDSNLSRFQGKDETEADNYSSIKWSKFAEAWNKWVDSLGTEHPEVTYKTVPYLKAAYKISERRTLQSSTLRQHQQAIDEIRRRHTNEDGNRNFLGEFQQVEFAAPICPQPSAYETTMTDSATDTDFVCRPTAKRKRNERHRCRRCGNCYAEPEWKPFHVNKISSVRGIREGNHLRNGKDNKVWENCTVNESDFEEGFKDFPYWDTTKRLSPRKHPRKHDNAA